MIHLVYYYYSQRLDKDTHCLGQYADVKKIASCLCLVEPENDCETTLRNYLANNTLAENILLLVPDASEAKVPSIYFQQQFQLAIKETLEEFLQLLNLPTDLPYRIYFGKEG